MEAKHDYYQNLSHESKANFEEHVYKSKTGHLFGERSVNNELSHSLILSNSSVENVQRLRG